MGSITEGIKHLIIIKTQTRNNKTTQHNTHKQKQKENTAHK